ncbi:MAG TPA: GspE/PulE family protein [Candidatus Dormibacteraeota bacterium]|nr:GspE/PulE family protein [Candidatus Dormibacteraeota bacterium]
MTEAQKLDLGKHSQPTTINLNAEPAEVLEQLLHYAEAANASDVHLQTHGSGAEIAFRLDGVMTSVSELPPELGERVFGRIKFLAKLKTYQESMPQDGRIDKADLGTRSDVRVATYPTVTGEKIVLRLFDVSAAKTLTDLHFPEGVRDSLEQFLKQTSGMLLLTGPAGSGKTTTIYSCLRELAKHGGRHIITVEDPAEQLIPGVMQTEVNEARGLDFAKAARHLLRQDPQVLVLGEIRDEETANIAIRAALTGHLVISTLHAGSCKGVFERLLVLCRDHSAVASCVELVLNQRLVRRLCEECAGGGCSACLYTGYKGRVAMVELLRVEKALRSRIAAGELEGLKPRPSLAESGAILVQSGVTDRREIERVLGSEFLPATLSKHSDESGPQLIR